MDFQYISIDPGGLYYAWWQWHDQFGVSCGFQWNPELIDFHFSCAQMRVICEGQLHTKNDRARRVDILKLAKMTGACLSRSILPGVEIPASKWKRQTSKQNSHNAILEAMSESERRVYTDTTASYRGCNQKGVYVEGMDLSMRADVSHAWGVGAYHFNRFCL